MQMRPMRRPQFENYDKQVLTEEDISVIYTDAGHTIRAGMISGALWGGVLGAFVGLLFPPVGLLVTAGPILGVFLSGVGLGAAGAVTVAALDGLIAALIHLGMPREIATRLGERVHKGDALVIAHAANPEMAERAGPFLQPTSTRRGCPGGQGRRFCVPSGLMHLMFVIVRRHVSKGGGDTTLKRCLHLFSQGV